MRQLKQWEVNWIQNEIKKQDPTYDPIKQQLKFNKQYPFSVEVTYGDSYSGVLCKTKTQVLKEIKEYTLNFTDKKLKKLWNSENYSVKIITSKRIGLTDDWKMIKTKIIK